MSKVIYYVAMSVDGMIAGPGGDLGWLHDYDHSGEDYGYQELAAGLGASIMGASTYEWVLAHAGEDEPSEDDTESVVMTRRILPQPKHGTVRFTAESPTEVVAGLKAKHQKDIWLVGGGKLAAAFAAAGLIDVYDLTLIPVVLGAGIPLVEPAARGIVQTLKLVEHKTYPSGVVRLKYAKTSPPDPLSY